MRLHELTRQSTDRKRVGRGRASGTGKTAGRGTKGQKSRSGHHYLPARFEGGQMPLSIRIPKLRGFRNPRQRSASVSLRTLESYAGTDVTLAKLQADGVVSRQARYLKVIGADGLKRKVNVSADAVTAKAEAAIKKAGGTVKVNDTRPVKPTKPDKPTESAEPTKPAAPAKSNDAPDDANKPSADA